MDQEAKKMFGTLMGQIYRTQRMINPDRAGASDADIYGLLNGIEDAVDQELAKTGWISKATYEACCQVLDTVFHDPERLESFTGFYEIEDELRSRGVSRSDAIRILKYLRSSRCYTQLIDKMDSSNSPGEFTIFELDEELDL